MSIEVHGGHNLSPVLVGIGLTEPLNSGWAEVHLAYLLMTSLLSMYTGLKVKQQLLNPIITFPRSVSL